MDLLGALVRDGNVLHRRGCPSKSSNFINIQLSNSTTTSARTGLEGLHPNNITVFPSTLLERQYEQAVLSQIRSGAKVSYRTRTVLAPPRRDSDTSDDLDSIHEGELGFDSDAIEDFQSEEELNEFDPDAITMAAIHRPKQRVLVRWNDDLDKSLLLHIAHTCSELGIKIPYDEVARRMGSTFTEGAIVQHIAKLRNKMAEIGTVPVPPPPRKGLITTRPSSVYAPKSRAATFVAPAPRSLADTKSRTKASSAAAIDDDDQEEPPTLPRRKAGTTKKPARRQIKKNFSDDDLSDVEYEEASGAEYEPKKRKRATNKKNTLSPSKKFKKSQNSMKDWTSKNSNVLDLQAAINDAEANYEREMAMNGGDGVADEDEAEIEVPVGESIQDFAGPATRTRGIRRNYAVAELHPSDDEEQEEVEEVTTPTPTTATARIGKINTHGVINAFGDDDISPGTTIDIGRGFPPIQSLPNVGNDTLGAYSLGYQMTSQPQPTSDVFAANPMSFVSGQSNNLDFGQANLLTPNSMLLPSVPTATYHNLANPSGSLPSSRHDSLISASSSYSNDHQQVPGMHFAINNVNSSMHDMGQGNFQDHELGFGNYQLENTQLTSSDNLDDESSFAQLLGYVQSVQFPDYFPDQQ